MCWVLYVASAHPLPLIRWDSATPAFNVTPLREADTPVLVQFTLPHVVSVGAHTGCGCGFDPGQANPAHPDEARDSARSLEALAAWLRAASAAGPVELYACWNGDEALPAEHAVELAAEAFRPGMEWLAERTLVTIRAQGA